MSARHATRDPPSAHLNRSLPVPMSRVRSVVVDTSSCSRHPVAQHPLSNFEHQRIGDDAPRDAFSRENLPAVFFPRPLLRKEKKREEEKIEALDSVFVPLLGFGATDEKPSEWTASRTRSRRAWLTGEVDHVIRGRIVFSREHRRRRTMRCPAKLDAERERERCLLYRTGLGS